MRVGSFYPTNPPLFGSTTLVAWYAADQGVILDNSIVYGKVKQWNDSSGNGNHLTQGTTATQATYNFSWLNGHPALIFSNAHYQLAAFSQGTLTQPITIISVAAATGSGNNVAYDSATSSEVALQEIASVPEFAPYAGVGWAATTTIADASIAVTVFNTTSSSFYKNGVLLATGSAGTDTMTGITVGSNFVFSANFFGTIAEVLVYNKVLTNQELNQVQQFLAGKYGISCTTT